MNSGLSASIPKELHTILFEELLQNPFLGINITDADGRVVFLNKAHKTITGHNPQFYLGRTMAEVVNDGLISQSATAIALTTKKTSYIQQISSHKDKYFQVAAVPIFDDMEHIIYVVNYLLETSKVLELQSKLQEASKENKLLQNNNIFLRKNLMKTENLIFQSDVMHKVVNTAIKVAEHDVAVLITGPSGSGKEMIANLIHNNSHFSTGPFIKINCAAIPEQLLESELFGYEPGAFTGGNAKGKKGLIENAHNGTLLLDEIGEMPLGLQSKLLRVLQNKSIRHIGGTKDIQVQFRLVTSTNADLTEMIEAKTFREDLYYRLNVIEITLPSLEERKEDLALLIQFFLQSTNAKHNVQKTISASAMRFLESCTYPGNVRQLRNVIERVVIMAAGNEISLSDAQLATSYLTPPTEIPAVPLYSYMSEIDESKSLKELLFDYERIILLKYQAKYKNGTQIAAALQTDQSTISRKMKKHDIE